MERTRVHHVTTDELFATHTIASGTEHVFQLEVLELHVRLDIDPREATASDDVFTLTGRGGARAYERRLTVRDDQRPGDAWVDLVFDELVRGASYSLVVDPGAEGESYPVFEDAPCAEMRLHGRG